MTANRNGEWLNIYAHSKRRGEVTINASGRILQYGRSVAEHRWSYGRAPNGAGELRRVLSRFDVFSVTNFEEDCGTSLETEQAATKPPFSQYYERNSGLLANPKEKAGFFRRIFGKRD